MLFWNLISRGNRTIWLKVPNQEAVETKISEIEGEILWIGLPRKEGQITVLEKGQTLEIGFSFSEGYYCANTTVAQIGSTHGKVYGLQIPPEFKREQRRDFVRSKYSTNAYFTTKAKNTTVSAEIVDFSAGGLRVFVNPELDSLLEKEINFNIMFTIEQHTFNFPSTMVWKKHRDQILNAGFRFNNVKPKDQDQLMSLAIKYSRKA